MPRGVGVRQAQDVAKFPAEGDPESPVPKMESGFPRRNFWSEGIAEDLV